MKTQRMMTGLASALLVASTIGAGAATFPGPVEAPSLVVPAAGDCGAAARQVAAQYGGRARASLQNRGGQQVCVVVVVIDGKDGERPRRVEVVVPAN